MHDAADDTPVVDPRLASRVGGKVRAIFENWMSVSQKLSRAEASCLRRVA
jgi:hypothetical protein